MCDKKREGFNKRVIVHPGCIEAELREGGLSPQKRKEAKTALREIRRVLNGAHNLVVTDDLPCEGPCNLAEPRMDGDVYLLRKDSSSFVQDCVQPGDSVEILGAYRNMCVRAAANYARKVGAIVRVSKKGTFKL